MGVAAASMSVSILLQAESYGVWWHATIYRRNSWLTNYVKPAPSSGRLSSEIARRVAEEETQYQARAVITEAKFLELWPVHRLPCWALLLHSQPLWI